RLVLLQNADDLFVCKTVALHSLVLSMGQSLLQNGLVQRGKVSDEPIHHLNCRVQRDNLREGFDWIFPHKLLPEAASVASNQETRRKAFTLDKPV
ncbi:hypothetical protein, partial [uncultured Agrobacterium sp.]|uniref:hypothetical protein n=1 Tax=uncultured Agrobacterium sp. TaxID=157277 RepID=UPI0025FD3C77